jgi:hypothetical protein
MKLQTTLSVLAAAVALFSQTAFAQEKTRAEVKAEAASANKSGQITAGEAQPKAPSTKSDKNRKDVKADTAAANKAGKTMPAGETEPKTPDTKSNVSRATVKSETASANMSGKTMPAGEGGIAGPKK